MAHDPKLEIYKLKIFNKADGTAVNMREFFRYKLNYYGRKEETVITQAILFKDFYTNFVAKIDSKGYNTNEKKKKGFTIAFDDIDGKRKSFISSPIAKDMIISGLLEGGKHGLKRGLGVVTDTTKKTQIQTTNIVTDRFFFLLYTPLDHSEAIIMIQGYSEIKISDVFRDYLTSYFKYNKQIESKVELFVPQTLKDKYLKNAVFKSVKFSTGWHVKSDFSDEIKPRDFEFDIKIEIIDKNKQKSSRTSFRDLIKFFGKARFSLPGDDEKNDPVGPTKELEDFDKKDAKMDSNGKALAIDFDDEDNIRPVILLTDEGIKIGQDGIPDFDEIEKYCRKTLNDVIKEVMPTHAISEL